MRIGVNTIPLYPGQIGGMEKYTVNLLTHLTAIDRQHRYYLFVARYNRALFDSQFQRANVFRVQTLSLQGLRYSKRVPGVPIPVRGVRTSPPRGDGVGLPCALFQCRQPP